MLFRILAVVLILATLRAPVRGSPAAPEPKYNFYPLLSRRSPDGVWDSIAPQGGPPAGCKSDSTFRFGMMPRLAPAGAVPSGPMMTICDDPNKLSMNLRNSKLTDKMGRIGSIVANRQFQFDGPPAQAGAIYTAGWSICPDDATLALGLSKEFWRCLSGDFYNIYDQSIGGQCQRIFLQVTKVVTC
ncbi:hypothetical protein K440DRAFT_681476 [Wilcoxina mikolae CBS 423.85]|nr:hypothetical protein K440DRAFT_681476 [Wilcoxina mikolae CBS 423.85]